LNYRFGLGTVEAVVLDFGNPAFVFQDRSNEVAKSEAILNVIAGRYFKPTPYI
jgi:hypothetical protein